MKTFILIIFMVILTNGCSKDNGEPHKASESTVAAGHDEHGASGNENRPDELKLPENLLQLLQQEMQQIESGMQLLLNYLSRGDAKNAADISMQIHNSFILKQSLSKEQLQQLVSLFPTGFIHMDRAFHGQAKKLSEAVAQNDFTTSIKIYGDMVQACVSCHQQYAQDKFPGLVTQSKK